LNFFDNDGDLSGKTKSSESNVDFRESNRGISDREGSGSKSQRPDVVPSDKTASDLDSFVLQQKAATFDEGYSTPVKKNTFIQQESCTLGGSRTDHLGGISTSEDVSNNVNSLSDDLHNMFEDEDFGLFGNIFKSAESAMFVESKTLTNDRDSQSDLPRRSSRKTTLPRKLGDYVLDKKVKNSIDKSVNYVHLSKDNFVFATSIKKIIEPKTYLEAASDHSIEIFKARLVDKGFNQKEGIDYEETFYLVVKIVTIRCIVSLAVSNSWPMFQLDINNAFLYGELVKDVLMKLHEGYFDKNDNDIVVTGNNMKEIEQVKQFLSTKFLIKDLGKLKYFLGIEVLGNESGVCLIQRKYYLEFLAEFGMLASKPCSTLIESVKCVKVGMDTPYLLDGYGVLGKTKQGRFEAMAIETEKNAASGSTVVDENRGRDDVRQNPKKRGTSKDVVASLDQRVAGVETSMAELKNQVEGLEGLDSDFASMREDFREALNTLSGDLKRELHDLRDSFMGEITKIREEFGEEVSTLHQTIENLQADVALCKRSLASSGSNTNHGPKIDVPKPSPFVGKREARAVDDFLWEMEQYLEGVNMVDDTSKIKMATRYLKDTAALWWRRRYGDIERGTATIDTWAEFVADFKKQFYPENAKNEAKSRLRKLKQSGTIREYVKEFTTLVLEIPELSDQDSLFYFLDGLQGWAKTELERRGVQDLSTAIAQAEALIDFSTRRDSSKPKDKKVNQEKGGGDKNAQPKVDAARKPPTGKDKNLKTSYKSGGCFICDGPHRAHDCPKKRASTECRLMKTKRRVMAGAWTGIGEYRAGSKSGTKTFSGHAIQEGINNSAPVLFGRNKAKRRDKDFKQSEGGEVDHTIELEDGSKPPQSPYLNTSTRVGKLRKPPPQKLKEDRMQAIFNPRKPILHRCYIKGKKDGILAMVFTRQPNFYGELRSALSPKMKSSSWDNKSRTRIDDKIEQKKSGGLLEPLPTPKGPWESVSMDFITCLPKSEGSGSIIVVVDRFSKYGTFIAAPPDVTADDTAKLFFRNVVKYWGVPQVIVSDRDPRFTGRFWTELFKIMGTDLNFSTSFHPQTDGQTERVNALLELYLRHYVSANQHDWAKLLDVAQFSYNMQRSEATGKSPFELVTGRQPLTPNALAASYEGSSPAAYKTMKEWHEQADLARASLDKAAKKMKKWADERRRHVEFEVGDQVMVKLLPQQFKSLRKVHKGLIRRYEGPFPVIGRVGKVSYRVQLPPKLKIHPVFHVSFLKPYHGDEEDPERGVSKRAPTAVVTSYDREVEEILSDRTIRRRGVPSYKEYLIKWRDLPDSEASWEAEDLLWQFADKIKRYHEDGTTRTILWKVLEGLGSSWKLMEGVRSCRKSMKVMEALRSSRSLLEECRIVHKQGRFEAMAIKTEKNAASGSTVVDENRGRDDVRQNPKKRGTSKDVVASLDQRVAGVETSMAELKNQVEGLEGLDSDFASMREDFREALNTLSGDLKRELHDLRDSFMGEITKIREEFGEEVSTLHQTIENLQADVALCKRSLASSGSNTNHGPKIDVPKPSPFVGKREARAVDDFLWEMEQYLEGVNMVDDTSKIKMATRYLKDTAALWWRRRYGDIERGTATIDTWAEFVADFKKQFYPENAKNEAKSRLRKLKQSGTIREYVKEFTTLVLEISELSDQDSLFYFLDGLQGWAKTELERRGVQDLSTAIAQAEALIDFSTRRDSSKPKDKKVNQEKGGGDKNAQPKVDAARKPPTGKDKNLKTSYKNGGCFICDGPHRARDCPKKASLNGMSAHDDEEASDGGSMGSIRILN
ncbi:putative nucleotidyltransferase, ribonuclease H, partial [Tanacetum coccineum]